MSSRRNSKASRSKKYSLFESSDLGRCISDMENLLSELSRSFNAKKVNAQAGTFGPSPYAPFYYLPVESHQLRRVSSLQPREHIEASISTFQKLNEKSVASPTLYRAKLYKLVGVRWDDQGVVICSGVHDNGPTQSRLVVTSEQFQQVLLNKPIHASDVYQRQQETLIVWTEPDGTDFALSFEDAEGCSAIWNLIYEGRNRLVNEAGTQLKSQPSLQPQTLAQSTAPLPQSSNNFPLVSTHEMDLSSVSTESDAESPTDKQQLPFVQPELLAQLRHLDISAHIVFKETNVVSSGTFGDISKMRCNLPDHGVKKVAVKRLRFYMSEDLKTLFEKEIYVWSKLKHNNVLPLLGFAIEERTGYPLLVSEWMRNGSAWNYVKKKENCDLKQLVIGIAKGLAYLHDMNVIHSDIKPDNIVISPSGEARICDFGGSRIIAATNSLAKPTVGLRGTSRYLACELIEPSGLCEGHTTKSDVWAFGMTIFALLTHQYPYAHLLDIQVATAITRRELPTLPPSDTWTLRRLEAKADLWSVCQLCWDHNPSSRADMSMILTILNIRPSQIEPISTNSECEQTHFGGSSSGKVHNTGASVGEASAIIKTRLKSKSIGSAGWGQFQERPNFDYEHSMRKASINRLSLQPYPYILDTSELDLDKFPEQQNQRHLRPSQRQMSPPNSTCPATTTRPHAQSQPSSFSPSIHQGSHPTRMSEIWMQTLDPTHLRPSSVGPSRNRILTRRQARAAASNEYMDFSEEQRHFDESFGFYEGNDSSTRAQTPGTFQLTGPQYSNPHISLSDLNVGQLNMSPRRPDSPVSAASSSNFYYGYSPYPPIKHSRSRRHSHSSSNPTHSRSASPAASVVSAATSLSSSSIWKHTQSQYPPLSSSSSESISLTTSTSTPIDVPAFRRKRRLLNKQRKEICQYYNEHPTTRLEDIANLWGVERSTVTRILKNKNRWLAVRDGGDQLHGAKQRSGKFGFIEDKMTAWLEECKESGTLITDAMIRSKARECARSQGVMDDTFKASAGWVQNYKHRAGIKKGIWVDRPDPGL